MRAVGLLANNEFTSSFLEFLIGGITNHNIHILEDVEDIKNLNNPLVIATVEGQRLKDVVELKKNGEIDVELLGIFQHHQNYSSEFNQSIAGLFPLMGNATSLLRKVEYLLHKKEEFQLKGSNCFVPLNKGLLVEFDLYPFDIYFKVNSNKRIKIYNQGEIVEESRINKILDSNGNLLIKYNDFIDFISKLEDQISKKVNNSDDSEIVFRLIHDSASDFITKVGLTEESIELANQSIKSVMNQISKDEDLLGLLFHEFNRESYKNEHSMMIPFLATAMCAESSHNSKQNLEKMVTASFFHDITLKDELAEIDDLLSYEFDNLSSEDKKLVQRHMFESIRLLKKLDGVPEDVEKIILQHHEKYDGTGFPRALDTVSISPLAAIFNVAHEFVHLCYEDDFKMQKIINVLSIKYTKGQYKKAIDLLIKVIDWC